jgi:hypothetical protein
VSAHHIPLLLSLDQKLPKSFSPSLKWLAAESTPPPDYDEGEISEPLSKRQKSEPAFGGKTSSSALMEAFRESEELLMPPITAEDYKFVEERICSNGSQVDPQKVQKWCKKFGVKPPSQIAKTLGAPSIRLLINRLATAAVKLASSDSPDSFPSSPSEQPPKRAKTPR